MLQIYALLFLFAQITAPVLSHVTGRDHSSSVKKISPEIVNDLKDFSKLIPTAIIDGIIAQHLIFDSNFRKGLKFVRSDEFVKLLHEAEDVQEVDEVLNFLHIRANDSARDLLNSLIYPAMIITNDIEEPETLEIVLLDDQNMQMDSRLLYAHTPRSFTSFFEQVMQQLPRDKYVAMINEKRQKSELFANFYKALRSPEFQPLITKTMKSPNLQKFFKTLKDHKIDVQSLLPTIFEVISWGPNV